MNERIICPFHDEKTPSLVLYPDTGLFKCFGCGKSGKIKQLPKGAQKRASKAGKVTPKEDLGKSISYIHGLSRELVRGLSLPCDEQFYYILWPGNQYYKKRSKGRTKQKYYCPTGCQKPLFWLRNNCKTSHLIIVEGELNALSIQRANLFPPADICSPGGAGDFYSKNTMKNIRELTGYTYVHLIADDDEAGAKAIYELAEELKYYVPVITFHLMKTDANDILQEHGPDQLRDVIQKTMESLE